MKNLDSSDLSASCPLSAQKAAMGEGCQEHYILGLPFGKWLLQRHNGQ